MRPLLACLLTAPLLALMAPEARAQDQIGYYHATLGPQDMVNSSGQRLADFCAIVQQDRANYHRFHRRDPEDGGDPFFATPEARAQIPYSCRVMPGFDYIPQHVLSGRPRFILVRIIGVGNRITALEIQEGAG